MEDGRAIIEVNMARYAGMTTVERLGEAGLLEEFLIAASKSNSERMIYLLSTVEMDIFDARITVEKILRNPDKYGIAPARQPKD